ncbi:hypothetical protein C0J52_04188 [Blattella germanica]|nr:hypothetical protein C0J52_04188 [Blattella germanica]
MKIGVLGRLFNGENESVIIFYLSRTVFFRKPKTNIYKCLVIMYFILIESPTFHILRQFRALIS